MQDAPKQSAPEPGTGMTLRQQVLEVIVRQALAGAPWQEICAGPMQMQNITIEEVEEAVKRRKESGGA